MGVVITATIKPWVFVKTVDEGSGRSFGSSREQVARTGINRSLSQHLYPPFLGRSAFGDLRVVDGPWGNLAATTVLSRSNYLCHRNNSKQLWKQRIGVARLVSST